MLHGAHHSFGLGEWDIRPISLFPSVSINIHMLNPSFPRNSILVKHTKLKARLI